LCHFAILDVLDNCQPAASNMSSEKLGIVARNVRVEFGELHRRNNADGDAEDDQKKVTPLDFYDGNGALTEVFHALSVTFPVGETFFINSVMHYAPRIRTKHPELWKQASSPSTVLPLAECWY